MDSNKSLEILMEKLEEKEKSLVKKIVEPEEAILSVAKGNLDEEGNYSEYLLVVTGKRIVKLGMDGKIQKEMSIQKIMQVNFNDYLGNSELILVVDGKEIPIARFSREKIEEFRHAAGVISALLQYKEQKEIEFKFPLEINNKRKTSAMLWLMSYLKPYWYLAAIGLILSIAITGLNLAPPSLLKTLIDQVVIKKDENELQKLTFILISIYAISTLLGIVQNYSLSLLSQKLVYSMRKDLYAHVQELSMSFYDKMSTGRVISRITDDISRVQWFLVWGIPSLVINVLSIIGIGMIIFTMDYRLSLFALLPFPLIIIGLPRFRSRARIVYHKAWRKWADLSSLLVDTIPGISIVKSFVKEREEVNRLVEKMNEVVGANMDTTKLHLGFFPLLGFVSSAGAAIVWYVGGLHVIKGDISPGTLVAFVSYMWMFYGPIQTMTNLAEPLQQAITSGERVLEILRVDPVIKDAPDAVDFEIKGNIKFEHVTFGYEPFIPVLKDINFEVKAGKTLGIVGQSGSGKTTVTKLLLRFYDVNEGRILIDGVDIRKIKIERLRKSIGIVSQDPFLFDNSILFNITYGLEKVDPKKVIAAAKAANIHEEIMNFQLAYDSPTGERGSRLSGGERQRVAIARAIILEPKILIMDEATSSVDTLAERKIQEALDNISRERTIIAIAHRLSTLQRSDKIIVIEKGRIVEEGTHEELLKKNGLYAKIYKAQFTEGEKQVATA
ncbi:MAG: ABC transporter transmembrane domain-containing protein [Thermoproteota archaeon]|nr:ATP-binding cassette domain-containing protein [Candidatus Brockarchaeota archaeon]MBO3763151.1 ATP-binding cassette domain-containing protein [Candidatus Brockarchaeota archaeon]MBO3768112.1 ATP-binding cassette domain-containing protein [Candidatus Brockarchaeota archaeon]MBO3800758.1 ATP-binding cassette domain-containing protein [Candidatus Brockarchaeota archaeon]